jgi:hypothetical protein
MTKEEIDLWLPLFKQYSERIHHAIYNNSGEACKYFCHNDEDCFHLVWFTKINEVYQLSTEIETIGIELETLGDLRTRFKSFTGTELFN